jgi:secondary thiamine-phosphate synthase enzyme
MEEIRVRTTRRTELVEVTAQLEAVVRRSGVRAGVLVAQSLHTTAGLTVNENADPDVARDMERKLEALAPEGEPFYRHAEGNSDSHVKTSLVGPSLTVIVDDGRLVLGTWQGVYLCEFDGPRERRVAVQPLAAAAGGGG